MTGLLCFLCGWLAALVSPAASADYILKTWGVDDGLAESSISDVVQTGDGYLWISTLNSGVSRFDGVRFVNYELPFSTKFRNRGVRRLFVDGNGGLWLNGFSSYLARLQAGEFHLEKDKLASVVVWRVPSPAARLVFATKEGQLLEKISGNETNSEWRITPIPGGGINLRFYADAADGFWSRRSDGQMIFVRNGVASWPLAPDGSTNVSALAGDGAGRIAVASGGKLFIGQAGVFTDETPAGSGKNFSARWILADGEGGWWIESNGRLRRCAGGKWIAEAADWKAQKRNSARIRWELADGEGGAWLAYTDDGILHVDADGDITTLTVRDGLPSNRVRTMMRDREGNVWATFEQGGLASIRPRLFQSLGGGDGLADAVTTSVCEAADGAIWIGTVSGIVSRWQNGVCTNFVLPLVGTHTHNEMTTVFPDAAGRVWIGTHGNGLWLWETNRLKNIFSVDEVGMNIRQIFASRDGRVWVAAQEGLFCWEKGKLRTLSYLRSEADYPTAITEGADGTIWVVSINGWLLKISDGRHEAFQPANPEQRRRFNAVLEDSRGVVWIGTLGAGLLRFENGKFSVFDRRHGLPSDNISQIVEDANGQLWLGTAMGIVSLRKEQIGSTNGPAALRIFGLDDGLPTLGCTSASQPTAWRGRDGRIWFATAKGIASAFPDNVKSKTVSPLVVMEETVVNGETAKSFGGALHLPPGRHQIEFHFTGLDFTAPERVRFDYQLEGWDNIWTENLAERSARYNGLLPGKYKFRVKARNADGVVSANEASIIVHVPPHIWETKWFRVLAVAAALLLVGGAVAWVSHLRHLRRVRELEQQQALERERTRIAQDIHDDLGASLTRISLLSQSALKKSEAAENSDAEVGRIYSTARGMTSAMDEIVWAINPRHDSLDSVAAYFAEFVEDFLGTGGPRFRLDFPLELPDWTINAEVRHNLFLALKEALNNVVKHAQASEVVVSLEVSGNKFSLAVRDDGCGFDAQTGAGRKSADGRIAGGNGLRNMAARLSELGGSCTVQSSPGKGTLVRFEMEGGR